MRRFRLLLSPAITGLIAALGFGPAQAYEAGDLLLRGGLHLIQPKSNNHDTVDVKATAGLTASGEYFLAKNLAVDLLVAAPFEHTVALKGSGDVAKVQHLPPTLSLVWYLPVAGNWQGYIGAGLNYTLFFNEREEGALKGTKLDLDPSFGAAALIGVEWNLDTHWAVAFDVRYMDIDSDASVDGNPIGTVRIDPVAAGISASYRF